MDIISFDVKFIDTVERNVSMGRPLMIENIGETIDPVLEPVLSRSTIKRGGMLFIKLGDKDDVEYDPNFRLYLQTKLTNPHYQPEVATASHNGKATSCRRGCLGRPREPRADLQSALSSRKCPCCYSDSFNQLALVVVNCSHVCSP